MKTDTGDSIYYGKDGRLRVYVRETGKTISYPKYIMERELGRQLLPNEHVHHKDKNPLNNELSNLEVMFNSDHASKHARKYFDTTATCGWCGREFMWTSLQQQRFYSERRTGRHNSALPFCSRECSGRYGRQIQESECNNAGRHPLRKLTAEQVKFIRDNYIPYDREYGSRGLGRKFGVDRTVIDCIVKNRTYKDSL